MGKVWVIAADAARARIFEADQRTGKGLREVETWVNPEMRNRSAELASDRPGRSWAASGDGRHAMDEPTDPKEVEAQRFAREVLERLNQAFQQKHFHHLVVAAAPHFLGLLRAGLSGGLKKTVSVELDKDLCHLERPEQIREHLPDFLY